MYPLGPIFHGSGLNITVMSLTGKLDVGLVSCPELLPDLWDMADDFAVALDEVLAATEGLTGSPCRLMAACRAMSLMHGVDRASPPWRGARGAGCSSRRRARRRVGAQPGSPVQWAPCPAGAEESRIPTRRPVRRTRGAG